MMEFAGPAFASSIHTDVRSNGECCVGGGLALHVGEDYATTIPT